MAPTTIEKLAEFGQSVWLDSISRSLINSGRLKEMVDAGLLGMTSNPTIFDKAISSSDDYDEKIYELYTAGKSVFEMYDDITIWDVQDAADIFMPVYEKTNGLDGYVSLEISPKLAFDTKETIEEGKRLYSKVNRPNVMFKVPATDAGFLAIEDLLGEGININITLIFSLEQYIKAVQAFFAGMKKLLQKQNDASRIQSVASLFVSRTDIAVDRMLDEYLETERDRLIRDKLESLKGKAAVANAKLIFKKYLEFFSSDEFDQLNQQGVNIQRVLWGSTSTKNPTYSDIKYVVELIGKNTINTMPENTFQAFLDHGIVTEALTGETDEAQNVIDDLKSFIIDINQICKELLDEGIVAFQKSFESLLDSIEMKTKKLCVKI
ncbi:transaldolase [bacterium]|nr:transaldolase [bacterium]NIN91824.1 transaldolase [bacterium]NIO18110.1 transaldolase [bacterium]NIO73075.1 transaldolase [bacterium]